MKGSSVIRFVGQNIKGTPPMRARRVRQDLHVVTQRADVAVLQEFRWPWYWSTLGARLVGTPLRRKGWRSYPNVKYALVRPTKSAQPVIWQHERFTKIGQRVEMLHSGRAGISEDRYLRAALLRDRRTGAECWYGGTHFVVGGDSVNDGPIRRLMLTIDLDRLDNFVAGLVRTGRPVVFQLDANVREGTDAHKRLRSIVRGHGGKFHGAHGVEYLFTVDGEETAVDVHDVFTVPTSVLNTDHEGRGIKFRLDERR